MTFHNQTYDLILQRMIAAVDAWARKTGVSVDTRDGSIIRFALGPAAAELMLMYLELARVLDESFPDTASWDYLVKRCAERGITPKPATKAIRRGEFNLADIPTGSIFSLNTHNYRAIEKIGGGVYKMECTTAGTVGNVESGPLIPKEYITGLEWARLTDVLTPGEDAEPIEHLRQRYFDSVDSQAFGGNIADYVDRVGKLPGVGGLKVYPAWNGGGTVKLVIINSLWEKPAPTLLEDIQTMIDPEINQGAGLGLAPIGHIVTVAGVNETVVNVSFKLTYKSGWNWDSVQTHVINTIEAYFQVLAREWDSVAWRNDPASTLTVRISKLESQILAIDGILDIADTKLNGKAANLILDPDAIPVRGAVNDG